MLRPTRPTSEVNDDGGSHMSVVVRVRPENDKELASGFPRRVVEVLSDSSLIFDPLIADEPQYCPGEQMREERQRLADRTRLLHFRRREKNMTFTFDRVFGEKVSNEEVYELTTSPMLDAYITGINCSVFCYGATGAGKTFTMLGSQAQSGVIFYTMRNLYERVSGLLQKGIQYNVKVSYLEIYNEQVRDLLAKWDVDFLDDDRFDEFLKTRLAERQSQGDNQNNGDEPNSKRLRMGMNGPSRMGRLSLGPPSGNLSPNTSGSEGCGQKRKIGILNAREDGNDLLLLEDAQVGVVVQGITYHEPTSAEELMRMLEYGNLLRTQHPTDANSESSRSHAVFQVYFRQKVISTEQTSSTATTAIEAMTYRAAKFSLIDLAGSERATATNNNGLRFREGANINKSLLALGNCINALADGKKASHIPYRNSKLTRLLKDSLAGNCQTCMIAAVSPSAVSYEDTYNTLKYADRARAIRIDSRENVVSTTIGALDLSKMVDALRRENAQLRVQMVSTPVQPVTPVWNVQPVTPVWNVQQPQPQQPAQPLFATFAKPVPNVAASPRETLVIDKARARLLERDLRLFRKIECFRRLKALAIDADTTRRMRDRVSQFIDANYQEQIGTDALVSSDGSESVASKECDASLDSMSSLVESLCAELEEDNQLIRELLSTVGHFFVLLKCEHLVTQANVEAIERLKQRILALENARTRQFRQPLTRPTAQCAAKREAGGVRWAERLEVDQPRVAYVDSPASVDDDLSPCSSQTTNIADDQLALTDLINAERVRGLNAKTLSRTHVAQSLRSLFVNASASNSLNAAFDKKTVKDSMPNRALSSLSNVYTTAASSELDCTNDDTLNSVATFDENSTQKPAHKHIIVVDEVDRFKKRQNVQNDESNDSQKWFDAENENEDPQEDEQTEADEINRSASEVSRSVLDDLPLLGASNFASRVRESVMTCQTRTDDDLDDSDSNFNAQNDASAAIIGGGKIPRTPPPKRVEQSNTPSTPKTTPRATLKATPRSTPKSTPKRTPADLATLTNSGQTRRRRMARKRASSITLTDLRNENETDCDVRPKKQARIGPLVELGNFAPAPVVLASKSSFVALPLCNPVTVSRDVVSSKNSRRTITARRGVPTKMRHFSTAITFGATGTTATATAQPISLSFAPSVTATSNNANAQRPARLGTGLFTFKKSINEVLSTGSGTSCTNGPMGLIRPVFSSTSSGSFGVTSPQNQIDPVPDRPVLRARRIAIPVHPNDAPALSGASHHTSAAVPSAAGPSSLNRLYAGTASWNMKQTVKQTHTAGPKRPMWCDIRS